MGDNIIINSSFERSTFFSDMSPAVLNALTEASIIEHFEKGEMVCQKGDPGSSIYIVVDGEAIVHDGDMIVSSLDKDQTFGEIATFEDTPRTASITAGSNLTLVRVGRDTLFEIMSRFPDSGIVVAHSLCRCLRDRTEEVIQGALNRVRMEQELQIGRKIQAGFIPSQLPDLPGWTLGAHFEAAKEVAGDFYDVFQIEGHGCIALIVADVCDKGVGAALFMTLFRSLLRSSSKFGEYLNTTQIPHARVNETHSDILKNSVQFTNNYVAATHGHTSMFSTLFFGLLEPETGHLYYINAGHEAPVIIRQDQIRTKLENTGPVVGLFRDSDYTVGEAQLEKGETLFAYTDGVTDAVNLNEEHFTEGHLMNLLVDGSADGLAKTIVREVKNHMGDAPQFDDITILTVSRH